jgi:hypothetical protein
MTPTNDRPLPRTWGRSVGVVGCEQSHGGHRGPCGGVMSVGSKDPPRRRDPSHVSRVTRVAAPRTLAIWRNHCGTWKASGESGSSIMTLFAHLCLEVVLAVAGSVVVHRDLDS